ncbi:hypothetical protein ACWGEU_31185 [Streptomyces goshikiensis]
MTASRWPLVTLFHPRAHPQNTVTEAAMTTIASRLGLLHGLGFRHRGELVYDIRGVWCLNYGHPRDALRFQPGDGLWHLAARRRTGRRQHGAPAAPGR